MKRIGFLFFVFCAVSFGLRAEELIQSFHSDIVVNVDGSMTVSEEIKVNSERVYINHGIYRDFPTSYKDYLGHHYKVDFEVLGVRRDGAPEDYHLEAKSNGQRVYMGSRSTVVSRGEHTYILRYRTNRQIGFFENHDELYWNVTGNGWGFRILKASASVKLPSDVPAQSIALSGYTGYYGSPNQNFESENQNGVAVFETTKELLKNQGLTIVVQWPKGFIAEPGIEQKLNWFLKDNKGVLFALGAFLLVLFYFVFVWILVGRDPEHNLIIPLFAPPQKMSPAACRFVREMDFDSKCFASGILGLAAKGYVKVEEEDRQYSLVEIAEGNKLPMTKAEKVLYGALIKGRGRLKIQNSNYLNFQTSNNLLKDALSSEFNKEYFVTNRKYFVCGVLLSLVSFGIVFIYGIPKENTFLAGFMLVWLSFWSIGVWALLQSALQKRSVVLALFSLPFIVGWIFGAAMLNVGVGTGVTIVALATLAVNFFFAKWLKQPTHLGQAVMDKIEGFRMYLSAAEDFGRRGAPTRTVELFESYLPYAVALDLEKEWAKGFEDVLAKAAAESNYQPSYYLGPSWNSVTAGAFASNFSSGLSSSISSASSPPGSSSGGGGGGFSGGGGGGGGGGGW